MVYECLVCDYKSSVNSNYNKHLRTKKHLRNVEKSIQNVEKSISYSIITTNRTCQFCFKEFSRLDSLKRHYSSCHIKLKMSKMVNNGNSINFANNFLQNVEQSIQNKVKKKEIKGPKLPAPQVPENPHIFFKPKCFKCLYCYNEYKYQKGLTRHLKNCQKNVDMVQLVIKEKNQEIESLKNKQEQEILILELEKEKALNKEKDLRLADQAKALEIAKNSKNITINNTTNKTINFLNNNFGEMIAMEQFLNSLEHTHQLTIQERKDLLNAYYDCGIDVFARNFSYIMKENCKRQLESQGIKDMKLIPLFCSDGNLRSHKEKQTDGWKTLYDNQSINHMINISNQQIYDTYQKLVPDSGKERNRVFKEIKKNNHQNNFKKLKDNNDIDLDVD